MKSIENKRVVLFETLLRLISSKRPIQNVFVTHSVNDINEINDINKPPKFGEIGHFDKIKNSSKRPIDSTNVFVNNFLNKPPPPL